MWVVYIIKCKTETLYIGITKNINKRLSTHNNGTGAKYTRGKGPFDLLYTESYPNRSEASKREYYLKNLSRDQKLHLIKYGTIK